MRLSAFLKSVLLSQNDPICIVLMLKWRASFLPWLYVKCKKQGKETKKKYTMQKRGKNERAGVCNVGTMPQLGKKGENKKS